MNDRLNKTSICTVIFLDIVGYSKATDAEQIAHKKQFNRLISEAIKNIAQNDRILIDTGDGAAIALLGAPEEALFISMTIRDGIHELNRKAPDPLLVRIGINLGPVRVVKDINGRPNIIGDGINVAQRVMSFADENQILVSRSYYEITSRLSKEITELFTYSGVKQDKHVREHEVYAIGAYHQAGAIAANFSNDKAVSALNSGSLILHAKRWWLFALGLILLILLTVAIFKGVFVSESLDDTLLDTNTPVSIDASEASLSESTNETSEVSPDVSSESTVKQPTEQTKRVETKPVQSKPAQPPESKQTKQTSGDGVSSNTNNSASTQTSSSQDNNQGAEKSTWQSLKESFKKGTTNTDKEVFCSDAQRMLKQCE